MVHQEKNSGNREMTHKELINTRGGSGLTGSMQDLHTSINIEIGITSSYSGTDLQGNSYSGTDSHNLSLGVSGDSASE